MSQLNKISLDSKSADKTEEIAERIGANLKGGEIIELSSDLGGGKTTFTRGLVRGAGSTDLVSSPSFTVKNVYQAKGFELWHFDFYRLDDAGMVGHELEEALGDKKIVVIVEWAKDAGKLLPNKKLLIKFHPSADEGRKMDITCPDELKYLVKEL